jgi:tyrocidine synthetase-3
MFINFIPLKIKLESHINFQDLVTQLGENFNHILKKHVRYPFDILSAELRKISRQEVNHFWNITLVGHPDKEKKDFVMEHISSGYEATPLTIHINCDNRDIDGILELEWVYQVEKFSDTHIRDMHQCLMHILEKGLAHPGQPVAGITLPEEEKMLLKGNPDRVTAEEFLQKHEYIDNAVVVKTNRMGEQVLCGYITASKRFSQNRLKDYLSKKIPAHLIPDHFFQLEKMPFSADGSIDRKRLAGLPLTWLISADQTGDDGKPANERENILQRLWAEVLEVPQKDIRTDTSFFELGGHSLKAVVLIAKIHKILDIKIPLAELFNIPTIRGLAEYIGKKAKPGTKENKYAAIVPIEKRQYYELSSAQKRLYFLQQLDIESVGYNISLLLPLGRDMEINKLASTLKHLITRHESLRTSFITVGDEPVQKIHEPGDMEFKIEEVAPPAYNDIKTPGKEKISHWPQKAMFNDFITPFDLSRAPLLRVGVFKNKEAGNLLMVNMHHIITDGTSLEVLRKEFHFLYGNENGSSPLKLQYRDFARWQNNLLSGDNIKKQETYWLKVLEGDIPVLTLPYDYSRPLQRSFEGNSVDFVLNRQAAGELKKLSKETSTTLYMSILSIFAILLSKLSGQEDIIVGMPITGRPHADLEPLIGMFVNTLPIRSYPCGEKTFKQFLMELKKYTIDAFENQDYQFEFLVNKAGVQRDTSRNPIFDAVLNLLNLTRYKGGVPPALNGQDTDSCELKPGHKYPHRPGTSKFDLNLEVVDLGDSNGEELAFTLGYSTQLFKTATIDRFIGYFKMIAETVVEHPWGKISDIEILSNEEKHRLLIEFNRTNAQYPQDKTIYRLFARQVERVPDQVALIGENPNRDVPFDPINTLSEHLTYRELNNQSTLLAHQLKEKGVQADTIVGIRGERSIKMVVGILGILMAGGAYMPIDPAYPEERTKFMLRDSNAGVLITTGAPAGNHEMKEKEESEKTGRWTGEIVNLDQVPADHLFSNFKSFPLERRALTGRSVSTLAYVIYTSGTTGTPKGTLVQHYNVVRLMTNDRFRFDFNKNDVWTLFHSFCFDFSVWEMYGSLLYGGKLVIVPWMIARDTAGFLELLKREKVTVLNQTPSAFYQLMTEELKTAERELNLKYIIFGGEALNPFKLKSWKQRYPKSRLINMYGITETTVHVTFKEITGQDMESPVSCIGVPIPTLTLYIINRFFKLQALGVPGELWVGGEGVSRGYLNRPELTAVKFDHDLWDLHDYHDKNYKKFLQGGPGGTVFTKRVPPGRRRQKLYKTGDLSRWLPNGEMEYLGRIDQQVKIRGYRIELEEIERQLLKHHKVKETVVLAMSTESEDKYLCAYIIPNTDDVTGEEFREYLSRSLPGYMIPTYFTTIEKIPLTPAGKINQKALPAPQIQTGKTQILPGNDIEKKLANIWKEILADQQQGPGTLTIGIDDNFFALGGHSLKAASMISKIQKELDVKIPLAEVFQTPTIRGLARFIFDRGKNKYTPIEVVEKKEYYALSSAQKRLLFLQHLEKNSTGYNAPQVHRIPGSPDIKKLQNIFYKLIKRHESLRTSFEIKNGESVQRVHESHDVAFQVECFDLEQIVQSHGDPATIIEKHITAKFVKPFDLAHAPLFRVGIAAIGGDTLFMLDMHHIITDGTARQVLTREFLLLYNNKDLIPLKLQYKDYSEWQRKTRGKGVLKKQEEYWLNRFKGTVPELNMPVDFTRPDSRSFEGDRVNFFVNESMTDRLHILLSETKTTLYMVLLAAYTILLSKYANQEDIVVGSPVMGRSHPDLHNIIGLFANMAAMRNFPGKTKTFAGFLEEVKTNALDAFENQDYQIEELVGKLKLKRDSGRHPLFEAVLVVQNMDTGEKEIQRLKQAGNFQVEHYNINFTSIQHELLLNVKETKKAIPMSLEFSTKLFKHTTAAKMVDHYLEVLDQVLKNREIKIKDIRISHDLLSATHNFSREEQEDFCL